VEINIINIPSLVGNSEELPPRILCSDNSKLIFGNLPNWETVFKVANYDSRLAEWPLAGVLARTGDVEFRWGSLSSTASDFLRASVHDIKT